MEMATKKLVGSQSACDEDEFGWQLFHDRQHNLIYYLHSFTGEVRWPRPETVGFVMHGLKPLPAEVADAEQYPKIEDSNPDIWSPYYPHVVMLPSGLVQVHPSPNSDAEIRCGYNRFPLRGSNVPLTYDTQRVRKLPPTWEHSSNGLPFLPPYPVAILHQDTFEENPQVASVSRMQQMPKVKNSRNFLLPPTGELGRVRGSMSWSRLQAVNATTTPATDQKQPAYPKGLQPITMEKKEHNRKGYLLRQARKQMRDCTSTSLTANLNPSATGATRHRKVPRLPTETRLSSSK